MLKALDEMEENKVVRLGDASIASPFTSKHSSINSGECTRERGECTRERGECTRERGKYVIERRKIEKLT